MRKISTSLAMLGLLAPLGANALGIGDIRLHSALNQSLDAEIPLVISGAETLSDIRVALASPEAFAKAGVERHFSLTKLVFVPIQKPNGSYVIKVSSRETLREPFLNFLVEVNWPQGRMLREFTALLDPPSTETESIAAGPSLPETEAPIRPRQRVATPVAEAPASPPPVRKPPPRRVAVAEPAEARPYAPPPTSGEGPLYGPVRRDETLLSIARQVNRDPAATPEQMTIALYRANPHAFYKNSVNALKAGESLRIPDRETVLSIPVQEARAQLYGGAPIPAMRREAVEAGSLAGNGAETAGRLRLEPPPTEGKRQADAAGGKSPDAAREELDTLKQEVEDNRRTLAEIRNQLLNMQRLLTLKDEQIAGMQQAQQKQPAATQPPPPETVQSPATQPKSPETVQTPATQPKPPETVQIPATQPTPPATVQIPATQAKPPEIAQAPATQPTPQPPVVQPKPPETAQTPKTQPAPPQQPVRKPPPPPVAPIPEEEPGIFDALFAEPMYPAMGAGALLLLGVGIWMVKRRRASMIDEMESILTVKSTATEKIVEGQSSLLMTSLSSASDQESQSAARSSFLSEFTPSDFDALGGDSEEVDPISEADVYLAYGRYKQAEELIRSAIAQHPDRDECKLKLLEIHYATENVQAFENYARELLPLHRDSNPDFWEKVVEMGRELCPNSPVFRDDEHYAIPLDEETTVVARAEPQTETEVFDLDKSILPDLEFQPKPKAGTSASPPVSEFERLQELGLAEQPEEEPERQIDFDYGGIDFDDLFGKKSPAETSSSPLSLAKNGEDAHDEELSFDNVIQFEPLARKSQSSANASQIEQSIDDFLAELEIAAKSSEAVSEREEAEDRLIGNEIEFDLSAFEKPEPEVSEPPRARASNADADALDEDIYAGLTDMDEQETKLDLAKAYVDMGDEAAAREILQTVVAKGNEQQREEAKNWLEKIGLAH